MKTLTSSLTILASFSFLAACGGSDSPGATEPASPTAETAPAPAETMPKDASGMLAAAEMTIHIEGNEAMRVFADGRVEANLDNNWTPVGMVKDDALWDKNETKLVWVEGTGAVKFADPNAPSLSFEGTTLVFGPNSIAVGDDGIMTGLNPGAEGKIRVEGATTDATKRTAALLTIAMMMTAKGQSTDAPATAPTTTP